MWPFKSKNTKKNVRVDCIDISAMNISTGQIGSYIKWLYNEKNFRHIGYEFVNIDGNCRFIIYTLPSMKHIITYFKDRCPAMVEQECISAPCEIFKIVDWDNGFSEVH